MLDPITAATRYLDICDLEDATKARFERMAAAQGGQQHGHGDMAIVNDDEGLEVLAQLAWCRGAREMLSEVLDLDTPDADAAGDANGMADFHEVSAPPPACVIPTIEAVPGHAGCYLVSGPANDAAGIHTAEWHALLTEEQLVQLAVALVGPLSTCTLELRARQRTREMRPHNRWQPTRSPMQAVPGEAERLYNRIVIDPDGQAHYFEHDPTRAQEISRDRPDPADGQRA